MMKPRWLWATVASVSFAVIVATWHVQTRATVPPAAGQNAVAVPVTTAPAQRLDVPQTLDALGTVTPTSSVKLRPQVAGQLLSTRFREGSKIAKGQTLAVVDSRELLAKLKQAQGALQRDQALRKNAQADLERDKAAVHDGSVTQQALDTQRSLVEQLEGTVLSDHGVIDEIKVQIGFTQLRAPIGGRIGLRQIDAGNIVEAVDADVVAVIDTISPISVVFTVPQEEIQRILRAWRLNRTLKVLAYDRNKRHVLDSGKLLAIDNHVDLASGTISLKATFANEQGRLIPNEFVNARLVIGTLHDAVVVPTDAVRRGRDGDYLYTVGADSRAAYHRVERGPMRGDEVVVAAADVHAGDVVVVEGADRLENGVLVEAHPRVAKPRGVAASAVSQGHVEATASAPEGALSVSSGGTSDTAPLPADDSSRTVARPASGSGGGGDADADQDAAQ